MKDPALETSSPSPTSRAGAESSLGGAGSGFRGWLERFATSKRERRGSCSFSNTEVYGSSPDDTGSPGGSPPKTSLAFPKMRMNLGIVQSGTPNSQEDGIFSFQTEAAGSNPREEGNILKMEMTSSGHRNSLTVDLNTLLDPQQQQELANVAAASAREQQMSLNGDGKVNLTEQVQEALQTEQLSVITVNDMHRDEKSQDVFNMDLEETNKTKDSTRHRRSGNTDEEHQLTGMRRPLGALAKKLVNAGFAQNSFFRRDDDESDLDKSIVKDHEETKAKKVTEEKNVYRGMNMWSPQTL